MKVSNHKGILLESGTNELEIIEFTIGESTYGINVIKVREVINPIEYTEIPLSHESILGITELRGEVIGVIDLPKILKVNNKTMDTKKWIIAEMNQQKVAFQVDHVNKIHRISWEQIEKPTSLFDGEYSIVVGMVHTDEKLILLLDYERILTDISPQSGISEHRIQNVVNNEERNSKRVLLAEDSTFLSKLITETITTAGYNQFLIKDNGLEMWQFLETLVESKGENFLEEYQCLITDIEMPKMDGLHLTKRVKEHPILKKMPVIVFSSLITDDVRHKGEKVGADAQISKPEIDKLVEILDELIVIEQR
jgi:two-component system, chemotaxis family, chemotaxis protein CheV